LAGASPAKTFISLKLNYHKLEAAMANRPENSVCLQTRAWVLQGLFLIFALVLPAAAHAQGLFSDPRFKANFSGNVTVALVNTAQTPTLTTNVFSSSTPVLTPLLQAYASPNTQSALKNDLISALNSALNSHGGFGVYMSPPNGPVVDLATPTVSGFSDPNTQQIGFMLTAKNNSVSIDITTPGPLPSSTNPKVTLTFSAQAAVLITLQSNQLSITQAVAQVSDANLSGNNISGDIVKALSSLGIIKLPSFDQSANIPTSLLSQLNTALAAGNAAAGALGGTAALVAPTTAITIHVTVDSCAGGLQSVASPCTCAPGANVNYPSGCDPYGTAMCLSAAQLAKVPSCTGQYLACGKLPSIASRDRSGNWFNKVALNCMKIPVSGVSAGGTTPPINKNLPISNIQNSKTH
jgi:hypothetical protein